MSGTVSPLTSLWDVGGVLLSSTRLVEVNCFIFPCYQAGVKVVIEPAQPFFKAKALFTIPADAKDTIPVVTSDLSWSFKLILAVGRGSPLKWPHPYEVGIITSALLPKVEEMFIFLLSFPWPYTSRLTCVDLYFPRRNFPWCLHSILVRCKRRRLSPNP